jgi:hypothetical protein
VSVRDAPAHRAHLESYAIEHTAHFEFLLALLRRLTDQHGGGAWARDTNNANGLLEFARQHCLQQSLYTRLVVLKLPPVVIASCPTHFMQYVSPAPHASKST